MKVTSLLEAAPIHSLRVVHIASNELAVRLGTYGIFTGAFITKSDPASVGCSTLKIRTPQGNIVLPGKITHHIHVRTEEGMHDDLHLAELAEGTTATITTIEKEEHAGYKFKKLGLEENVKITLLRRLPHMVYQVLIDNKRRVRITEDIAASIIGETGRKIEQLALTSRKKPFKITEIAQEDELCVFLRQIGIELGSEIILESVGPGESIAADKDENVVVFASNGAWLSFSNETASQIMVQEV